MRSITMTAEQTEIYDNGADDAVIPLMDDLRAKARAMADLGSTVEIYTADGILADAVSV